jgi:DNA-binding protein YbaB
MSLRPGETLDDGWTLADSSKHSPARGRTDRARTAREADLAKRVVDARAGGGLVQVQVDGHRAIRRLVIAPELFEGRDADLLADLIMSAIAEAQRRADELAEADTDPSTA